MAFDKMVVMHLRSSSGGGGGPDKTILKTGQLIDTERFSYLIAYIRNKEQDLSPIVQRGRELGLEIHEFAGRRIFDLSQIVKLVRFIKASKVHILHCHDAKSNFIGVLLRLLFPNLVLVSTKHGWIKNKSWRSPLYVSFDKRLSKYYHAIIAVSSDIAATAERYGARKVYFLPNAIDPGEWRPPVRTGESPLRSDHDGATLMGFVGRLSPEKGPLDFVLFAKEVLGRGGKCKFVVAGEGPQMGAMRNLAGELGVASFFHFLGQVPGSAISNLYGQLDLLVSTSYSEGLPNNLLEACAMMVPIVATRVGGVPDIISHGVNGFLSPPGDIARLADYALTLMGDLDLAQTFRKNGRKLVETRFSFRERVRKLESIYEELIWISFERSPSFQPPRGLHG